MIMIMIIMIVIKMMTVIKHCEARCRHQLATTKAVQIASLNSKQDDHHPNCDDQVAGPDADYDYDDHRPNYNAGHDDHHPDYDSGDDKSSADCVAQLKTQNDHDPDYDAGHGDPDDHDPDYPDYHHHHRRHHDDDGHQTL